jgi:uncharacterized SAM-binding protein YcdF (DUF218 family)
MFFLISKIGWLLIQPIGLITLCFAAILAVSLMKRRTLLRVIALAGLALTLLGGQTNIGRLLLQPLENRFTRPIPPPDAAGIAGIIVLGGGFDGHVTRMRGGFELGESGDRFTEAVRLARINSDVPVIVSGGEASLIGKTEGDASIAERFFAAFGIDPHRLILEAKSLNTHENAMFTKRNLPADRSGEWLLITSAFHMPRSMGAFRKAGLDVVPWPVDFRTTGEERFAIGRDDPIQAFAELSLAMREWVGLFVYTQTGRISSD